MTPLEQLPDPDHIRQAATLYAASGYLIFPLWPNKTPRTPNGMKDATTDPATILRWWTMWPEALIGCRIPPDVVVIDVDPKHSGMTTWKALRAYYGDPPPTPVHKSGRGDGGGHLWFRRPPGKLSIRPLNQWAKANNVGEAVGNHSWVSGIDLLHHGHRYTILPPSPHPATGEPYRWAEGRHLDDLAPAECPGWLAALITEQPQPIQPTRHLSVVETDSIADWFSQTWSWNDLLIPEGWYRIKGDGDQDGSQWRHPNATTPFSATTRNQCLFVYSPNTDFEPTEQGDPHGYTRFRAYALLAHNGDMTKAARKARELKDGHTSSNRDDDYSWVTLTNGTGTQTTAPTEPNPEPAINNTTGTDTRLLSGSEFLYGDTPDDEPIVGQDNEILMASGEATFVIAITGVGKSTFAQNYLLRRVGYDTTQFLGYPVRTLKEDESILYVAADRPRQIRRSLLRMVTPEQAAKLHDRLLFWKGPLEFLLNRDPLGLLDLVTDIEKRRGVTIREVVLDSLKDVATELSKDEGGAAVAQAINHLVALNREVLVLHHERKPERGAKKAPANISDVYGSQFLTACAGNVIYLHGDPGGHTMILHHLKQSAEQIGPLELDYDHDTGALTVHAQVNLLDELRKMPKGMTVHTACLVLHGDHDPDKNLTARVYRKLEHLVEKGFVRREKPEDGFDRAAIYYPENMPGIV